MCLSILELRSLSVGMRCMLLIYTVPSHQTMGVEDGMLSCIKAYPVSMARPSYLDLRQSLSRSLMLSWPCGMR